MIGETFRLQVSIISVDNTQSSVMSGKKNIEGISTEQSL